MKFLIIFWPFETSKLYEWKYQYKILKRYTKKNRTLKVKNSLFELKKVFSELRDIKI